MAAEPLHKEDAINTGVTPIDACMSVIEQALMEHVTMNFVVVASKSIK